MTEDQDDHLQNVLGAYNDEPQLCTDWEQDFMNSLFDRYEKHGSDTYLSEKQFAIIARVAGKYGLD